MAEVQIRDATPDDMAALGAVFRRSSLSNAGDRAWLLRANPDALELSDLAVREGRTRAAVFDGRIVGFASTIAGENTVELEDLFVDPDAMRRGVASALVRDVVAAARARGDDRIEVTANHHTLAFYEAAGFENDGIAETRGGPATRMHLDTDG